MKDLKWILQLIVPFWPRILLALLLSALTISSHIGLMATAAYLLARAALHPPVMDLMVTIVGVRFFGISRAVLRYLERLVSHDLTFRLLSRLRVLVYQRIEPLAPARLMNFRSGDLLSRIVGDVELQQNLFLRILAPPLVALIVLFGYGGFLSNIDHRLSYILAGFFLLAGLGIPLLIRGISRGIGQQRVKVKAKLHTVILDLIQGMPEILTFGQVETTLQDVKEIQRELNHAERKQAKISGISHALMGIAINLGMVSILVLGIILIEKDQLKGLYLGMLAFGALSSFEAVMPLPASLQHLEENQAAGKRLGEIIQQSQDEVKEPKGNRVKLSTIREYEIKFSKVRFRYHEDEPWVLKDITFTLPHQGRMGIIGPSGAGKSSIVNLLLGFWDYEAGEICLGGYDLKGFEPNEVRAMIGVVTQRPYLFHATVKENLLMAKPNASDAELFAATRRAKLHDFILSLPQGYDSLIGENGMKLSGGQQQRLAIARVILKNAPILILDEATTGLDPITERDVLDELLTLMQGRTTLVISHHLEAIQDIDEVFVLDQGQLIRPIV